MSGKDLLLPRSRYGSNVTIYMPGVVWGGIVW